MSWGAVALWVAALVLAASLSRMVARLVWAFALAAGVLLALHFRASPAEAMAGFAALGGGLVLQRPMRRMLVGFGS